MQEVLQELGLALARLADDVEVGVELAQGDREGKEAKPILCADAHAISGIPEQERPQFRHPSCHAMIVTGRMARM